ncbi:hypothetical protein CXG81DRAFT_19574 [Caulochytrium protostelioides]|uniref:Uncharacterized protein n=1 Tax=Caulochytrium protostelioides TaxID=1555241 RepID=A0A4P9X5P7_9FUNG|nr:hypothetical protein CXG81DRAFT_19574 [Caulochytrium protostelioides]|eukprot:RKP00463.1 hypothetical protein CXG81DRAFT_19574 [Caulochytrium protostelioides]
MSHHPTLIILRDINFGLVVWFNLSNLLYIWRQYVQRQKYRQAQAEEGLAASHDSTTTGGIGPRMGLGIGSRGPPVVASWLRRLGLARPAAALTRACRAANQGLQRRLRSWRSWWRPRRWRRRPPPPPPPVPRATVAAALAAVAATPTAVLPLADRRQSPRLSHVSSCVSYALPPLPLPMPPPPPRPPPASDADAHDAVLFPFATAWGVPEAWPTPLDGPAAVSSAPAVAPMPALPLWHGHPPRSHMTVADDAATTWHASEVDNASTLSEADESVVDAAHHDKIDSSCGQAMEAIMTATGILTLCYTGVMVVDVTVIYSFMRRWSDPKHRTLSEVMSPTASFVLCSVLPRIGNALIETIAILSTLFYWNRFRLAAQQVQLVDTFSVTPGGAPWHPAMSARLRWDAFQELLIPSRACQAFATPTPTPTPTATTMTTTTTTTAPLVQPMVATPLPPATDGPPALVPSASDTTAVAPSPPALVLALPSSSSFAPQTESSVPVHVGVATAEHGRDEDHVHDAADGALTKATDTPTAAGKPPAAAVTTSTMPVAPGVVGTLSPADAQSLGKSSWAAGPSSPLVRAMRDLLLSSGFQWLVHVLAMAICATFVGLATWNQIGVKIATQCDLRGYGIHIWPARSVTLFSILYVTISCVFTLLSSSLMVVYGQHRDYRIYQMLRLILVLTVIEALTNIIVYIPLRMRFNPGGRWSLTIHMSQTIHFLIMVASFPNFPRRLFQLPGYDFWKRYDTRRAASRRHARTKQRHQRHVRAQQHQQPQADAPVEPLTHSTDSSSRTLHPAAWSGAWHAALATAAASADARRPRLAEAPGGEPERLALPPFTATAPASVASAVAAYEGDSGGALAAASCGAHPRPAPVLPVTLLAVPPGLGVAGAFPALERACAGPLSPTCRGHRRSNALIHPRSALAPTPLWPMPAPLPSSSPSSSPSPAPSPSPRPAGLPAPPTALHGALSTYAASQGPFAVDTLGTGSAADGAAAPWRPQPATLMVESAAGAVASRVRGSGGASRPPLRSHRRCWSFHAWDVDVDSDGDDDMSSRLGLAPALASASADRSGLPGSRSDSTTSSSVYGR